MLFGIAERDAFFVIRHHVNLTLEPLEALKKRGQTETGEVSEQMVAVTNSYGKVLKLRRVVASCLERKAQAAQPAYTSIPTVDRYCG